MASGGARNRSGPSASEDSGRSDRRGYSLQALPADGYDGEIPDWPLSVASDRELEIWERSWRLPQAWGWSQPSEAWREQSVALWVRTFVRCEDPDVSASLLAQLHRFADQVGLTTAGLREMGWKVSPVKVAEAVPAPAAVSEARPRRLRAVDAQ